MTNHDLDLKGQVAIVTGASSGIGRAAAVALAAAGAVVVVNHPPKDQSADKAAAVVDEIEANGGSALVVAADVTQEDQVQALVDRTIAQFGTLHIMVANAGIERPAPIHEMSLADWQAVIDVNLTGAFLSARAAAREFLRRGVVPDLSAAAGKIIFTSSVHEIIPWAFQANYAASKGGVMLLMKSLAQELAPMKIRVNSVAPGAISTPINAASRATPQLREKLLELILTFPLFFVFQRAVFMLPVFPSAESSASPA